MNAIIHILIHPLFWLWSLGIFGFVLYVKSKYRAFKCIGLIFTGWLFIISVSPIPIWLTQHLEQKYPPIDISGIEMKAPIRIMVLGAGHTNDPELPAIDKLSLSALSRLSEGIRIHKLISGSQIICSGYAGNSNVSQAEVTANAAIELGVDPKDTMLLISAHNTKAEAKAYADRFVDEGTLILVTDAVHMPRAMRWFQKHGIKPIAAPTNHYVKRDPDNDTFPFHFSSSKIILMEKSLHEYVGMLAR